VVCAAEAIQREQERGVPGCGEREGLDPVQERSGAFSFLITPAPIPPPPPQQPFTNSTRQSWTFRIIPKTATINAIVSLSLDPATEDTDFIRVKYHKDQANDKDYSHEGLGFSFKKWQADQVMKHMDSPEVKAFEKDKGAGKEEVRRHGSGSGNAPVKEL